MKENIAEQDLHRTRSCSLSLSFSCNKMVNTRSKNSERSRERGQGERERWREGERKGEGEGERERGRGEEGRENGRGTSIREPKLTEKTLVFARFTLLVGILFATGKFARAGVGSELPPKNLLKNPPPLGLLDAFCYIKNNKNG
jgi:hypothetical protein